MHIAVIGTGNIGGTLGRALAAAGHHVTFGSRHPEETQPDGVHVTGIGSALEGAEVVLLATPASVVEQLLGEHGEALDGKIVIDATNRIGAPVVNAAGEIRKAAPGARYVRAFNTLGWENFEQPLFDGVAADLFFSSPADDRATVERLISDVGLRPAYLGEGMESVVDDVLPVWFALMQQRGNRRIAFRILEA